MAKESCSRYKRSVRRNKSETAAMTKVPSKIRPPVPLIPYVRPQPQSFVVVNPVSFDKLMSKLNEVESRPARLAECNLNVSSMWICALCQKSSNVDGLGDLYGPYLAELAKMNWHFSDIPILSSKSDVKLGKKRLSVESINGDDSHYSVDVWFHGSCALWSPSLLLDRFTIDRLVEQLADAWRQTIVSSWLDENVMAEIRTDDNTDYSRESGEDAGCGGKTSGHSVLLTGHSPPTKLARSALILQMSPNTTKPQIFHVPVGISANRLAVANDFDRRPSVSNSSAAPRLLPSPAVAVPLSGQMKSTEGKLPPACFPTLHSMSVNPKVTLTAGLSRPSEPISFHNSSPVNFFTTSSTGKSSNIYSRYGEPNNSSSALIDMKRMVETSVDRSPIRNSGFPVIASNLSLSPRPTILRKRQFLSCSPTQPAVMGSKMYSVDRGATRQLFAQPMSSGDPTEIRRPMSQDFSVFWLPPNSNKFDPQVETPESSSSNESSCTTVSATSDDPKLSDQLECSPRKRPRKQQLKCDSEIAVRKSTISQPRTDLKCDEKFEDFDDFRDNNRCSSLPAPNKFNISGVLQLAKVLDDMVSSTSLSTNAVMKSLGNDRSVINLEGEYRPRPSLLRCVSGTRYMGTRDHFLHPDDVKLKEEKPVGIAELANQNNIAERIRGWKSLLILRQIRELSQLESANAESLAQLLEEMQESRTDDLMSAMLDGSIQSRTAELVRENLQRCKVIKEQTELVGQELKQFVKHQSFVEELLQKYHNRRPIRKKNLLGPCKDEFK